MGVKTSTNRYICNYFIIIWGKRKVPENGFTKPFLGLLAGWASWIRTSGMRESKSRALPLGDGPLLQNGKSACEFAVPDFKWGGRWDSNPRQPEPQSGALPTELHPPYLVRPKGLEPLAHCLEGSCSIHLSYGRKCKPRSGHCLDILQ